MKRVLSIIIIVLAAIGLLLALYVFLLRPWHMSWGATPAEQRMTLPGDEKIPHPQRISTRAITIHASAEAIWPWVAQMGADKGGLYSYTWLESLIRCPIVNADRIHPKWQAVKPGDLFRLCPGVDVPPPYVVISVEPGKALVVGHSISTGDDVSLSPGAQLADTWVFALQPIDAQNTRLLVRGRSAINPAWMTIIEPGEFVMERGMMRGIRSRAETLKP